MSELPITSDMVAGCRRGDAAAQRTLYDATSTRVYRLLLRMTRNEQDAVDLAQEVYVKVFTRLDQFAEGASITTWIHRIAVNEALQFLRAKGRRLRLVESAATPDESPSKESQIDASIDVHAALDRLPEEERALLVLRYLEGLDYDEMAEIVGKPAGTIGSGLNRARKLLRKVLEGPVGREEMARGRHLNQ